MKIFAISVIKNEQDIIEQNLLEASKWADKIFVLDNGSEDDTWAIVNKLKSEKIVPWKTLKVPFYEGLRAEVFNQFKNLASEGDWWCFRLDADEFYIDNPRYFLRHIPPLYHYACTDSIEYHLTKQDIQEYEFSDLTLDLTRIKYYNPYTWSEARFFRFRKRLKWNPKDDRPKRIGIVYPQKIRLKHYQYRSPLQIQKRLETRQQARALGFVGWQHASQKTWIERIKDRKDLFYDNGSINLKGCRINHRHKWYVYIIKRIMHGLNIWP